MLFPEFPHCCFPRMDQASNFLCLDCVCAHVSVCVYMLGKGGRGEEGNPKGREFNSMLVLHMYPFDPFLFR